MALVTAVIFALLQTVRSRRQRATAMGANNNDPLGFHTPGAYAGTDSVVLDADFVSRALASRERQADPRRDLNVVIGIRNGVVLGAGMWCLIFAFFRLL